MFSCDALVLADKQRLTYLSFMQMLDSVLSTFRDMANRDGWRDSRKSVLSAQFDDDS